MPPDAISIGDLVVDRGGRRVLEDVSLAVPAGSITGLLGPSGCGKSTLMRAIVGVQIVASGNVTVLGEPAGSADLRRRVGYVTQAPSVYLDLSVGENLGYFARVLGTPADRVDEVVRTVGLAEESGRVVGSLSGGQRARVSLATALLNAPELLVLDEPTVGLDPVLRTELWADFRRLAKAGTTLLVSSHVMDEADRCDVIVLMRDGRILACEPREQLLARTGADGRGIGVPAAGGLLSGRIVLATATRVLRQLRRDPRTLALLIVVPCVLEALIKWVFEGDEQIFQRVGVPLVGIFPLVSMFLVTSIAMLRERTTGTLERLMTMPLAKLDLLLGYGLAFAVMATVQAVTVSVVAIGLLGLDVAGSTVLVVVFAVLNAVLGMSMGLFLSAFASTEFQAVQFMPAFLLPQLLLCGLLAPRDQMARPLELISYVLPMTYAYDALSRVASSSEVTSEVWRDAVILVGATVLALCGGAATLHRRTA